MAKQDPYTVCVKFEPDDFQTLEKLVAFERLSRSDVVRRAVRAYADKLLPQPKPKHK